MRWYQVRIHKVRIVEERKINQTLNNFLDGDNSTIQWVCSKWAGVSTSQQKQRYEVDKLRLGCLLGEVFKVGFRLGFLRWDQVI
jgi:hypothetical protein